MARVFKWIQNGNAWDGTWGIDYKRSDGKRRRELVGPSHALAKEVLAKRLNEAAENRNFPGRVANAKQFAEVADRFKTEYIPLLKSRSAQFMFPTVRAAFAGRRMGDITTGDVQRFYTRLAAPRREGLPPRFATANRYMVLLSSIFSRAREWGEFHGDNPCAAVKRGQAAAHRLRYLSADEMESLLRASHPRLYPVVACALLTGMRRGEILGLTWQNISLERDTLYILQAKSGKPRELPIPAKLREVLLSVGPKPSGPVFDLPVIMLRRFFAQALKKAAIQSCRFHDLRHSFASHFIMRTSDLTTLQKLLGHATPMMTLRYAHLSRGHVDSAMAAFEGAIPTKPRAPVTALPGVVSEVFGRA